MNFAGEFVFMKWSNLNGFRIIVFILYVLCLIAGLSLTILDIVNILPRIDMLEDIIDCIFWLSAGILFWKKESLLPIVCFVMSGLQLICVFL